MVKACACLNCGKELDAATPVKPEARPRPGDISVCIYCGHIAAFDEDLSLRGLTAMEMVQIAGNSDLIRLQKARKEVIDRKSSN